MKDARLIAQLESECFSESWSFDTIREQLSHENVIYTLLYDENENAAGFALGAVCADEAELYRIAVLSEIRKKGFGSRLMNDFEKLCREKGAEKIFLEVRSKNIPAVSLYKKCGFSCIHTRKNYYSDDDAAVYLKNL